MSTCSASSWTCCRACRRLNVTQPHKLCDQALRGDVFRTLTGLLGWWLARVVALAARGALDAAAEVTPGERDLARRMLTAAPPAAWAETWTSIGHLAARTEAVHVDRKRALMGMLLSLETVAQGKAA